MGNRAARVLLPPDRERLAHPAQGGSTGVVRLSFLVVRRSYPTAVATLVSPRFRFAVLFMSVPRRVQVKSKRLLSCMPSAGPERRQEKQ